MSVKRQSGDCCDKLQLSQEQIEFFDNKITKVDEIFPRYFLIRAEDFKGEINDALDEWVYFFKNAQVQGKIKAKGLDKAKKRLDVASLSETDRKDYDKYLESLHNEASYKAQLDFEANKKAVEAKEKIAENLIQLGISDAVIIQSTKLSAERIQEIKQNIADKK